MYTELKKLKNFRGNSSKSKKRKQILVWITIFVALLTLAYVTGFTSTAWFKVQKFFSVIGAILAEFTLNISRDINDTKILIWTKSSPLKYFYLTTGDTDSLLKSNFNKTHPTKILIHGFSDSGITSWTKNFRKHYLQTGDYNVISIDWAQLAESPWYTTAAKNAKHVGKFTADFILFLVSQGVSFDSLHVIGASLGAQVAGYVGFYLDGRLARITGLDPSGPLFHSVPRNERLDSTDARFVDVIHTAGKWVGNDEIIGHADFFPNNGRAPQPGCEGKESLDLTCSHFKAWRIYGETIEMKESKMYGLKCENADNFNSGLCCTRKNLEVVAIGERMLNTTRGIFFFVTNPRAPHAKPIQESVKCEWVSEPVN